MGHFLLLYRVILGYGVFKEKREPELHYEIIPSQMEVAPLHCTVDIPQKRRLFKNTKEIEKM